MFTSVKKTVYKNGFEFRIIVIVVYILFIVNQIKSNHFELFDQ